MIVKNFLTTLFALLRTTCPFKNKVIKGASCLSPRIMGSEILRRKRIEIILQALVNAKQLLPLDAEVVKKNYSQFCSSPHTISKLSTFNWRKDRLDELIHF